MDSSLILRVRSATRYTLSGLVARHRKNLSSEDYALCRVCSLVAPPAERSYLSRVPKPKRKETQQERISGTVIDWDGNAFRFRVKLPRGSTEKSFAASWELLTEPTNVVFCVTVRSAQIDELLNKFDALLDSYPTTAFRIRAQQARRAFRFVLLNLLQEQGFLTEAQERKLVGVLEMDAARFPRLCPIFGEELRDECEERAQEARHVAGNFLTATFEMRNATKGEASADEGREGRRARPSLGDTDGEDDECEANKDAGGCDEGSVAETSGPSRRDRALKGARKQSYSAENEKRDWVSGTSRITTITFEADFLQELSILETFDPGLVAKGIHPEWV